MSRLESRFERRWQAWSPQRRCACQKCRASQKCGAGNLDIWASLKGASVEGAFVKGVSVKGADCRSEVVPRVPPLQVAIVSL